MLMAMLPGCEAPTLLPRRNRRSVQSTGFLKQGACEPEEEPTRSSARKSEIPTDRTYRDGPCLPNNRPLRTIDRAGPFNAPRSRPQSAMAKKVQMDPVRSRPGSAPAGGRSTLPQESRAAESWPRPPTSSTGSVCNFSVNATGSPWPHDAGWLLSAPPPRAQFKETVGMDVADIKRLVLRKSASKIVSEKLDIGKGKDFRGNVRGPLSKYTTLSISADTPSRVRCLAAEGLQERPMSRDASSISGVPTLASSFAGDLSEMLWSAKVLSTAASGVRKTTCVTDELLTWTEQLLIEAMPPAIAPQEDPHVNQSSLETTGASSLDISSDVSGSHHHSHRHSHRHSHHSSQHSHRHPHHSHEPRHHTHHHHKSSWALVRSSKPRISAIHEAMSSSPSEVSHILHQDCGTSIASEVTIVDAEPVPPEASASSSARPSLRSAVRRLTTLRCLNGHGPGELTLEKIRDSSSSSSSATDETCATQEVDSLTKAFMRVARGKLELDSIQLGLALQLLGHWHPDQELVKELSRDHVSLEKFAAFIEAYETQFFESTLKTRFILADTSKSGKLSQVEISTLLREQDIAPVPGVVEELLQDALASSGSEYYHGVEINFEDFVAMQEIMHSHAGFSLGEAEQLRKVFVRFDRDADGIISPKEVIVATAWTGSSAEPRVVEGLISKVDPDSSGRLTDYDFLFIMQKIKQWEIKQMASVFEELDRKGSGAIDTDDLITLFETLGHTNASPELMDETMVICGLAGRSVLLFDEVYTIAREFRKGEGFLQSEREVLSNVFKLYDDSGRALSSSMEHFEGSGELGPVEMAKAMEHMGFQVSPEKVVEEFGEFAHDQGRKFDLHEFTKVIARYRNVEMQSVRDVFRVRREHFDGQVPIKELDGILRSLGYLDNDEAVRYRVFFQRACKRFVSKDTEDEPEAGLWELARLVFRFRSERACKALDNNFFTDGQLAHIRKRFRKHEAPHGRNHGVPWDHVPLLLDELHPECRHKESYAESLRPEAGWKGKLDYKQCLQLMRKAHDRVRRDKLEKEWMAAQSTKFTNEEVSELRRIFGTFGTDRAGELSMPNFAEWISDIVSTEVSACELELSLKGCLKGGPGSIDFAEFLLAMRKLLDEDWHNINSSLARVAKEAQIK